MKAKTSGLKIALAAAALAVALAGPSAAAVFKIGTISPEGSFWMETMREGADRIAEKTDNRVRFKFYPGGVMGSDQAVLRKIRIGQLQGGAVLAGSLAHIYPDYSVYALPFTFNSLNEVDYVRRQMDPMLTEGLEKNGFVSFGPAEGGFVYLMSKSPVRSATDLGGMKVWIPDNDEISLESVKSFGISPVALSIGEVRTGLQTGLIDVVGTSPIGALALHWHTQVQYLMDVPLLYVYASLVLDRKAFDRLSPQDQSVVRETMTETFKKLDRENRKDNIEALQALKNQGIDFLSLSDDTVRNWKNMVAGVPELLIERGRLSRPIYQTMKTYLEDFRSRHARTDR